MSVWFKQDLANNPPPRKKCVKPRRVAENPFNCGKKRRLSMFESIDKKEGLGRGWGVGWVAACMQPHKNASSGFVRRVMKFERALFTIICAVYACLRAYVAKFSKWENG